MSSVGNYTDEELVNAVKTGSKEAFEIIYNKYAGEMYRYARRVIVTREDCEEIIQDVFEYLWKVRATVNIKSLRPYLFKAVANKVAGHLKKGYLYRRYAEHFRLFEEVYDRADDKDSVYQMIEAGLKQLPDRVQMAIRLRLQENLSNDEIALRMQVTNKTIENYMHQVYTHFRVNYPYFARTDT